uniref:diphosphoinositol-polyphosphate diphosphatase n=2 Tax=Ascaris TaxID=6251 RepID=A0A0M3IT84_ASCLU
MHKRNGERQRDEHGFRLRAVGVCTRGEGQCRQILLVTGGKDEQRWVIPGGGIEKNEGDGDAAVREVLEEAGVRARIITRLGEFRDEERRHRTVAFLLSVEEELDEWEDGCVGRKRQWMSLTEGLLRVKSSQAPIIRRVLSM